MWRELCWRYVVFPYRAEGGMAEVVFAAQMQRRRPAVRAAVVPLTPANPDAPAEPPAGLAPGPQHGVMPLST